MIDLAKEYRTANGEEVRFYDWGCKNLLVHGAVKANGEWNMAVWNSVGQHRGGFCCGRVSSYDLVEHRPRIKRTVWLGVHKDEKKTGNYWPSAIDALRFDTEAIAIVEVTIDCQPGEGLRIEN